MDNHSWEVIENNYLKGDRYLKAEKADSKGRCSEMGTAVPIIEQSYPANSTPEEYKYWSEKYTKLKDRCLPMPGNKTFNDDWMVREDKRQFDGSRLIGATELQKTEAYEDWYTPKYCAGSSCPFDMLPNEAQIGTGHWTGYLESPGDCKSQGGKWLGNDLLKDGNYNQGGACIFRKGHVPKFVEAAKWGGDKKRCESEGFTWDDKWLNGISSWSTPCYYQPTAEDDATYIGTGLGRGLEALFDDAAVGINNIPEVLGFWARVFKWLAEHPLTTIAIVITLFFGPELLSIFEVLFLSN